MINKPSEKTTFQAYGQALGLRLAEALQSVGILYDGVETKVETIVQRSKRERHGDVDLYAHFPEEHPLHSLFPGTAIFSPEKMGGATTSTMFAELKRQCPSLKSAEDDSQQFADFWDFLLLKKSDRGFLLSRGLSESMIDSIQSGDAILIFAYDGSFNYDVLPTLKSTLAAAEARSSTAASPAAAALSSERIIVDRSQDSEEMVRFHDLRVVAVYVNSADILYWPTMLRIEAEIRELKKQITDLKMEMGNLKASTTAPGGKPRSSRIQSMGRPDTPLV